MKSMCFRVSALALFSVLVVAIISNAAPADKENSKNAEGDSQRGSLKRIVLLKFKEGLTPEKIETLTDGIRALKGKVPSIATLNVVANTNSDNNYYVSKGFTHIVLVTFKTPEDRAAFLTDPVHKAYETQELVPQLAEFLVVEFTLPPTS
jgi:hypothetical protein